MPSAEPLATGQPPSPATDEEKETSRLEAFSDGVFAIAITLLVLNLKVPPRELPEGQTLLQALGHGWAMYEAFLISFATVGVMWISHHRLFTHIRRVDHGLLALNTLLLLGVTVVPFPTALLAEHRGDKTAAEIFCGAALVIVILFNLVWRYARHGRRLLRSDVDSAEIRRLDGQYALALALYGACFALSFVSIHAGVKGTLALAFYFALSGKTRGQQWSLASSGAGQAADGNVSR